jgi:hypothetical protein
LILGLLGPANTPMHILTQRAEQAALRRAVRKR